MIVKLLHQASLAASIALVMASYTLAQPALNWNAAQVQSDAVRTKPAPNQAKLAQSPLGASGMSNRFNELNPQPLPPAQPNPGDPLKSGLDNRIKPLAPLVNDKVDAQTSAAKMPNNLFDFEDRAIIIVGGKQSTAGEVKKALGTELAKKAGAPKTVKGGVRKLDFASLNLTKGAAVSLPLPRAMDYVATIGKAKSPASQSASASTSAAASRATPSALHLPTSRSSGVVDPITAAKCLDKGPPAIDEVSGRLKPGGKITISGRCLGDRSGRVEIIGQFPGGKLNPAFTAWDMTGIEIEIPANIRGAVDHAVAVTVITADGRKTSAQQAQFVASRERVDVPERLWSPTAKFELSATGGEASTNAAYSGRLSKTLRINPQCALYDMDAVVLSGGIAQIRGWEQSGPPNEASVQVDWVGTCTGTKITTSGSGIPPFVRFGTEAFTSACRVAFQTQARAYCPAGVAP